METVDFSNELIEAIQPLRKLQGQDGLCKWNLTSVRQIDIIGSGSSFLLEADNGVSVRISESAAMLLQHVAHGRSLEAFAREVSAVSGSSIDVTRLEVHCCRLIAQLETLYRSEPSVQLPRFFWFRTKLIPAALVCRAADKGAQAVSILGLIVSLLCIVLCWTALHAVVARHESAYDGPVAFVLLACSLLVHELGHASACSRFKVDPKEIGFALYLIYPVFYTDVTRAWLLRRGERVVVDLSGCLFQSYALGLLSAGYLLLGLSSLKIAILANLYSMAFMLNPIFKFDGYWVLADVLGIHRLSKEPREILIELFRRAISPDGYRRPRRSKALTAFLLLYTALSVCVWSWFTVRLVPFMYGLLKLLKDELQVLGTIIAAGRVPPVMLLMSVLYSLLAVLMVVVTTRAIIGRGLSLLKERK